MAIYADQLMAQGHDVTVVARRREPSRRMSLRRLSLGQRMLSATGETHFDRMRAKLIVPDHFGALEATDVPDSDCLIATWWETAFEAVHLPQSKGTKVYFVQHHEVFNHLPRHISAASYLLPLKKVTISSWLANTMRDCYGDAEVALVPNAVDHRLFFACQREKQSVPTVGVMYSTAHFKGTDIAFRAIQIARERYPGLRVIAFGAVAPARHLPLPKGTKYHLDPPQESIRNIYSACDAFIVPSRSEGFGLPILEAMACRTPVIASKTGCAEDVIDDVENGFVVDVEDPYSMADRIIRILSMHPDSWKLMSDKAYEKVAGYSWDTSAQLFEEALVRSCR